MNKLLKNNEICNRAISLKNDLENGFLTLARELYEIKANSLWEGVYGSWVEFTMELRMSENSINKLIQMYEVFVVKFGFDLKRLSTAGGYSLVQDILPACTTKKQAEKWLHLSETLTRADLRKELKEARTGISQRECPHTKCNKFDVCEVCGEHFFLG